MTARLRRPGRPTRDLFALIRTLLLVARRAGFSFEEAWDVASVTALSYMNDRRAEEWWDALTASKRAWVDSYPRRGSRLGALPRG